MTTYSSSDSDSDLDPLELDEGTYQNSNNIWRRKDTENDTSSLIPVSTYHNYVVNTIDNIIDTLGPIRSTEFKRELKEFWCIKQGNPMLHQLPANRQEKGQCDFCGRNNIISYEVELNRKNYLIEGHCAWTLKLLVDMICLIKTHTTDIMKPNVPIKIQRRMNSLEDEVQVHLSSY